MSRHAHTIERPRSVAIIGTRGYPSYYGGFETAVRRLAPYLAEKGWSVTVYGRKGSTNEADPARDMRVISRTSCGVEWKSLSTLSYGLSSTLQVARERPDVALVMNVANGFWLPVLKARGVPTLVNVDGVEWERAKWGRLAKSVFRRGAKLTAKRANRLVFDAQAIAARWKAEFNRDGDFIPYGGNTGLNLPIEPGLVHRNYVLVVARFVPENTIPEFLEACNALAERYDIVIVGSSGYGGTLEESVSALAAAHPRLQWLGHLSDDARLFALWQHAGAYFHGHSVGGTNPALVQAMACGAPIVARKTIYNSEVLASTAVMTAPDPASIVEAIELLMGNPQLQEKLSRRAIQRARDHYSWESVCNAYETSLLRLITKP